MEFSFDEIKQRLLSSTDIPLPGPNAQYRMTPPDRKPLSLEELDLNQVKSSAVSALFRNRNNRPNIILIQRNTYPGVHSGQIGFPGGRKDPGDKDFLATALRETREEINLHPSEIQIIRELTDLYIPPSNFLVKVFVGLVQGNPVLKPDPREVAGIIELDFNLFLNEKVIVDKDLLVRGNKLNVPVFEIEDYTIWGATAMMINELKELILNNPPIGK